VKQPAQTDDVATTGRTEIHHMEPEAAGTGVLSWLRDNPSEIPSLLREFGALVLRGFRTPTREEFEALATSVSGPLMDYEYRSNARTRLTGNLFDSTDYPSSEVIPFHNEMSYFSLWPRHAWFMCEVPAKSGGATPLANSADVWRRLPQAVKEPFERLGVRYTRTIGHPVDLGWQDVFQTNDKAEVAAYCKHFNVAFEWLGDDLLQTSQVRPATAKHNETGETVWFNQAHLFHPSSLGPEIHEWLLGHYGEPLLPRNASYGDGSPIPLDALEAVRAVYRDIAVSSAWQAGDVLVFDNVRFAHSRGSFEPPRRIVVALAGIDRVSP